MPDLCRANLVGQAGVVLSLLIPACRCDHQGAGVDADQAAGCDDRGTVYVAGGAAKADPRVRLRAQHGGCEPCPSSLRGGAAPKSPCQAPSVCREVCCACPKSSRFFTASACLDGKCADTKSACQAALERFGGELCRR